MSLFAAFQSAARLRARRSLGLAAGALASVALLTGAAQAAPATGGPALWVVKDRDSTIYLFGTVHVLRPELQWRSAKIDKALASADELILEINDVDDQAAMTGLIQRYGLDLKTPLSTLLSDAEKARLGEVAKDLGLPVAAFDAMKPWLAGLQISVAPLLKAGYDPKAGVEILLKAEAQKAGKPVGQLETSEQQIRFFDGMPREAQLAYLRQSLKDYDRTVPMLDGLAASWAKGDVRAIERDMVRDMRRESPGLYKLLLTDRNADWARQIKAKLKGKGVTFIAVGAAHLAGPDSVQVQLRKLGVQVRRR
jgi:uncharacterized protein YbaP (TraB family)